MFHSLGSFARTQTLGHEMNPLSEQPLARCHLDSGMILVDLPTTIHVVLDIVTYEAYGFSPVEKEHGRISEMCLHNIYDIALAYDICQHFVVLHCVEQ